MYVYFLVKFLKDNLTVLSLMDMLVRNELLPVCLVRVAILAIQLSFDNTVLQAEIPLLVCLFTPLTHDLSHFFCGF